MNRLVPDIRHYRNANNNIIMMYNDVIYEVHLSTGVVLMHGEPDLSVLVSVRKV